MSFPNKLKIEDGVLKMIDGTDTTEYLTGRSVDNSEVIILPRDMAIKLLKDAENWRLSQMLNDTRYALCA